MPKKKNSKIKSKSKKEKKMKLGTFKETAREKLIGQHIGYRYDVNLLPDYNKTGTDAGKRRYRPRNM
jgi:hypothetical protein